MGLVGVRLLLLLLFPGLTFSVDAIVVVIVVVVFSVKFQFQCRCCCFQHVEWEDRVEIVLTGCA